MKRTVIKQQSSLTMTLPKKWVERHGVQPASELTVIEAEDGTLTIRAENSSVTKSKTVQLQDHTPSRLRTLIAGLYRRGYDKIVLESTKNFEIVQIEKIIQTLTGLQVVSFQATRIELECTATIPSDISTYISKLFILSSYIVKEKENLKADEIDLFRRQSLELRDYICRCIHKISYGAEKETEYQILIFFLEKFANAATRTDSSVQTKSLTAMLDNLRIALLKKDIELAQTTNTALSLKLKQKMSPQEFIMADHLFSISSRVFSIVA